MEHNRSWSIDDRRLNFQFGCEIGWEVRNGRKGRMLKNPSYTGIGPRFWSSLDMLGGRARASGGPGAHRTAARASPARSGTPATARRRPASPASGWGCADDVADLDSVVSAVLDEVRRRAGAEAAATVRAESTALALTRFAGSAVHQNVADQATTVHLQLTVDGGRTASASTTRGREDSLADLVAATLAAARLLPRDPAWPGLGTPAALLTAGNPDGATAEASPSDRAAAVAAFVDAAGGLGDRRVRADLLDHRRPGRHRRAAPAWRGDVGGLRRHRPVVRGRRRGPGGVPPVRRPRRRGPRRPGGGQGACRGGRRPGRPGRLPGRAGAGGGQRRRRRARVGPVQRQGRGRRHQRAAAGRAAVRPCRLPRRRRGRTGRDRAALRHRGHPRPPDRARARRRPRGADHRPAGGCGAGRRVDRARLGQLGHLGPGRR